MIKGIGIDIEEVKKVEQAINKEYFIFKSFTVNEIKIADTRKNKVAFYADNFCVKEAVSKAFGRGFRDIKLKDIEVLRDKLGAPYVILHNNALTIFNDMDAYEIKVSISNTKNYASAVAIIQ